MFSSVALSGRLLERVEGTSLPLRKVEVDHVVQGASGGVFQSECFLVYAPVGTSYFLKAPVGSYISLKGSLQNLEGVGLVIVDEFDEIIYAKARIDKMVDAPTNGVK